MTSHDITCSGMHIRLKMFLDQARDFHLETTKFEDTESVVEFNRMYDIVAAVSTLMSLFSTTQVRGRATPQPAPGQPMGQPRGCLTHAAASRCVDSTSGGCSGRNAVTPPHTPP